MFSPLVSLIFVRFIGMILHRLDVPADKGTTVDGTSKFANLVMESGMRLQRLVCLVADGTIGAGESFGVHHLLVVVGQVFEQMPSTIEEMIKLKKLIR